MDGSIEEPLASALGVLAVAGILWDVGNQTHIENALAIGEGVKATIKVEVGTSEVHTDLFSYAFQCFQPIREQHHVRFIDGSNGDRR